MQSTRAWRCFPTLDSGFSLQDASVQERRCCGFAEEFAAERALCERSGSLAAYGALYWIFKNRALLRYREAGYPVLPVAYEALVKHPERELRRVCAALGVAFEEGLLLHPQHAHAELYANGLTVGDTDPRRCIDDASVGQWRTWLSADDQRWIREIALPLARQLASVVSVPWSLDAN